MNPITLFVDKLTIVDYAYFDSVLNAPVGDTVFANVNVIGSLDEEGVVFDFSLCKKAIKKIIDEEIDHKLVVPKGMLLQSTDKAYSKIEKLGENFKDYSFPNQAVTELDAYVVNLSSIANHLQNKVMEALKAKKMTNVLAVEITLEEEKIEGAWYRYTHGLKDHYGNCQRLIHGHRSRIEVFVNEKRAPELEETLAAAVNYMHFVYKETLEGETEIKYESSQGLFSLDVARQQLVEMPVESTVENIAQFFVKILRSHSELKNCKLAVKAYEGIEKGAIAVD